MHFDKAKSGGPRLAALSLVLFAIILIPRLHNLDGLVTSDERFWMTRSANFLQALDSGELKYTDQFVHPGVTVMWLGAAAYQFTIPELPELMKGQLYTRDRSLTDLLTANGYSKIDTLVQLRRFETTFSALVLLAVFICASRIIRPWHAFAAVLFVSLDPMHIGFTRLLHLDGLSTNLLLLALVAFTWHFERRSRVALIISGIAAGAAYLTRSANIVLIPLFGMIAFLETMHDPLRQNQSLIRRGLGTVRTLCPWALVSLITFVACWPALWVAPGATLRNLLLGGASLASAPHSKRILFLGEVTPNDPGLLFYPVVLLYRLSPLTILGLAVVFAAVVLKHEIASLLPMRLIRHLLFFSAIYVATLSAASKKLDRYVLPSVITLDLTAGLGLIAAAIWCGRRLAHLPHARASRLAPTFVTVVLLAQASLAVSAAPYFIDEANPLLGGTVAAREQFSSGWGDGGKEVADALREIEGIELATVTGSIWPTSIDTYLPFPIQTPYYTLDLRGAGQWLETDYLILTYPEVQRQLYPEELRSWFGSQTPILTVHASGLEYAWIYDIRDAPLPSAFHGNQNPSIVWDNGVSLEGVRLPDNPLPGASVDIALHFESLGLQQGSIVTAEIVSSNGAIIPLPLSPLSFGLNAEASQTVSGEIALPFDLAPGSYDVRISVVDPTGAPISSVRASDGSDIGSSPTVGSFDLVRF